MRKTLSRLGNSEALVITREMKELTGIGSEVEVQVLGNAMVITPAQDAQRPETTRARPSSPRHVTRASRSMTRCSIGWRMPERLTLVEVLEVQD